MWKLIARGERGSPFAEIGSFASINDATQTIIKTEADPSLGAIFFRVYVDPLDANWMQRCCRVSNVKVARFYLLTRQTN